jgi:hypothetical protein
VVDERLSGFRKWLIDWAFKVHVARSCAALAGLNFDCEVDRRSQPSVYPASDAKTEAKAVAAA